jgi:predicted DNA-binding transcriptional regulator AlpA
MRVEEISGVCMENFYTAREAMKKLGLKKSTFYDLIKRGDIPEGIVLPLRRHALYPKAAIDKLAEEQARILGEYEQKPERLRMVIPTRDDLVQLVDIDRMVFHEETLILPDEQLARFAYNPEVMHVLKDTKTGHVLGGFTMSPLKEEVLTNLIRLEINETQIKPEDYLPYSTTHPQDCYVVGIIVRPDIVQQYYAGKLIYACKNYLIELLERGITIRRIYTVATTEEGDRIARSLHFTPVATGEAWQSSYEDFRRPYVLDLEDTTSKSKLVKEYQRHRMNRERRLKRYKRQGEKNRPSSK